MPSHPVVAGFELNATEQHLMAYWLADRPGFRQVDQAEILRGRGGLLYHPAASEENLQELLEWNLPLLTVTGEATARDREGFRERMRERGAAAIWELDEPDALLLPPGLDYPATGPVYLLDDRQARRRRYRQLLFFCGYDLRVDFRDSDDLLEILRNSTASDEGAAGPPPAAENKRKIPALLLIDLDSTRLDARAFFPALRRLLSDLPELRRECQIMLTKDFRRTGADLELLGAHVRPLARRIFAPEEAPFALLEGLLYSGIVEEERARHPGRTPERPAELRALRDILVGEGIRLHDGFPARAPGLELLRQAQLFRWLYDTEPTESGLLLSDRQAGG